MGRPTIGRSLNFSFAPLTPDQVHEAFDDYDRLTDLKHRHDPDRRLAPNHEIG